MINAVAGGGTLVSFPTLIALGLSPVTANATSTVAIWPGTLGGIAGYRRELRTVRRSLWFLLIPSLIGGIAGAVLLQWTDPKTFSRLVPWLILFATVLFTIQPLVQRRLNLANRVTHDSPTWFAGTIVFQLAVALYGGYFGAGIGILMLSALGFLGMSDIHQMNGLKNVMGMAINGVAAVYFVFAHMVYWPDVIIMAIGAIAGGYGGAGLARKIGRTAVRWTVIAVGFITAALLFFK